LFTSFSGSLVSRIPGAVHSINVRFSSPPQDSCLLLYDSMEFKLDLIEKSYQLGACVAQLAREYGINVSAPSAT
ncbi:transposase, partial [Shigella dysenteriae]